MANLCRAIARVSEALTAGRTPHTACIWQSVQALQDDFIAQTRGLASDTGRARQESILQYAPWELHAAEEKAKTRSVTTHPQHSAWKRAAMDRSSALSPLSRDAIETNLKALARLVPSLSYSQRQLSPAMLVRLAEDAEGCLSRVVEFRETFPDNNLGSMLATRPELLLREAFAAVPGAVEKLEAMFPGADIPRVVERQPYLLISNCDDLITELLRHLPTLVTSTFGERCAARDYVIAECVHLYLRTTNITNSVAYGCVRSAWTWELVTTCESCPAER